MKQRQRPEPSHITVEQMIALMQSRTGLFVLEYRHDDGCPAMKTQNLGDCVCNVETHLVTPFGSKARRR